jgi:hypothetical protein
VIGFVSCNGFTVIVVKVDVKGNFCRHVDLRYKKVPLSKVAYFI